MKVSVSCPVPASSFVVALNPPANRGSSNPDEPTMKTIIPFLRGSFRALVLACLATPLLHAQEMPEMPKPEKEHAWLEKLAGEWTSTGEFTMEPGKPPVTSTGTESIRMLGGFWLVSDGSGEMLGQPMKFVLTLGYNPEAKQYVGSWIDSMSSTRWTYAGYLSDDGKSLVLSSEGPCPMEAGKIVKVRETITLTDSDHKTFTSEVQGADGEWTLVMTVKSERVR